MTDVWWDDQYINAKQLHLEAIERGIEEPPKNPIKDDYSYWTIEMQKQEVHGPWSQIE
ncbi:hypothetical protein ACFTQ7_21370 [Lysinibacillus sp. NPDC056959]|uniref:hypothetical protein n=1 Tax=Lysinibacillus sp. NPDC056959 TaxID=3345981 RepID=UPI003628F252